MFSPFVQFGYRLVPASSIVIYWTYSSIVMTTAVLLPRWREGTFSTAAVATFWTIASLVLISFCRSAFTDPGYVSEASIKRYLRQFKVRDRPSLEMCVKCQTERPARAHHCSSCKQCVLRMDHHCPWINNCVGNGNQWIFYTLLLYSLAMGLDGGYLTLKEWRLAACPAEFCHPTAWYTVHRTACLASLAALSLIMAVAMILLITAQTFGIYMDRTTVELFGDVNAYRQSGVLPTITNTESCYQRCEKTCGYHYPIFWLLPCRKRRNLLVDDEIEAFSSLPV